MKIKNPGKSPKAASAQSPPQAGDLWEKKKKTKKETGQCLMATGSIVMIVGIIYITLNWFFHYDNNDLLWNQMLGFFQVTFGLVLLVVGFFLYVDIMDDGSIIKSRPNVPILSLIPVKLSGEACQASWSQPDSSVNDAEAALPPYDDVVYANNAAFGQPGYRRSSPQETGDEKGTSDETHSTCSNPPACKDIHSSSAALYKYLTETH